MLIRSLVAALAVLLSSSARGAEPSVAHFAWVSYRGHDPAPPAEPAAPTQFRNPIVPGFAPDPSILRVGDDFYLVNSSFAFYPGLPIFHSRDLVDWTQIGNAIDRPGQFDFSGLGIARAIFAPTLRVRDGLFHLIGTCTDCGGTFLLTASRPEGPWSQPKWLAVDGIDPDLFFDDDGRAWVANNQPPPEPPAYPGHRALWLQQLDLGAAKMIGPRILLIDGGVDIRRRPVWIEGPHLIKKDGWYYLIAAEGGTASDHSEVVFRSRKVTGPYEPGPGNPILTQHDLPPDRPWPVAAAGHADFVDAGAAGWWSVFLATRPYRENLSNLGRETFLLPVSWPDGWPHMLAPRTVVPRLLDRPAVRTAAGEMAGARGPSVAGASARNAPPYLVAAESWRDDFTAPTLGPDWEMMRTPRENWHRLSRSPLPGIDLQLRPVSVGSLGNPSFLGKRQRHADVVFEAEVRLDPGAARAGLVAFADERHYFFVGLEQPAARTDGTLPRSEASRLIVAERNGAQDPEDGRIVASLPAAGLDAGGAVRLRITARGPAYDFAFALGIAGSEWRTLLANADGSILASEPTNQFTGTLLGMYAEEPAAKR